MKKYSETYDTNGNLLEIKKIDVPIHLAKKLIDKAFALSDMVAMRCAKSGIAYPNEWKEYDASLRLFLKNNMDFLPEPPKDEKGNIKYPEGT